MRKIIQIERADPERNPQLFALCDDGSLFALNVTPIPLSDLDIYDWDRIPDIPQPTTNRRAVSKQK